MGDVSSTTSQAIQVLDTFIAALRDEVAAAKSGKGDSITLLTDGCRMKQGADHAIYTFPIDRPVAVSDDVPVELDVGGYRYKGSVLYINGDELVLVINTHEDLLCRVGSQNTETNLNKWNLRSGGFDIVASSSALFTLPRAGLAARPWIRSDGLGPACF
jgi:hypothetical protein